MDKEKLERVLDGLHGPRENFRKILTDKDRLLQNMCKYAYRQSNRKRVEPWSIISDITGHGQGVSSAIYELYRKEEDA